MLQATAWAQSLTSLSYVWLSYVLPVSTLALSAFMIMFLNSRIPAQNADGTAHGAFFPGRSGEPLLDGFRALYGSAAANVLSLCGVIGAAIWYAIGIVYFAAHGRKAPVYSPEEDFAVKAQAQAGLDKA